MNYEYFACERQSIDSISRTVQRNILIQEYCKDEYHFLNLVDIYYRITSQNTILMIVIISMLFPMLFIMISTISDKYLSVGIKDLCERFNLSPTLSAVIFISLINGLPKFFKKSQTNEDGLLIGVGTIFCSFIFSSTIILTNVINKSKTVIRLPKNLIRKEFIFYFLSVILVIAYGLIG